ncbi:ATP-binding protein [Streptomyces sp. NPDC058691]|uniref:ATP-binding protein n=1 Tax=Streptomyces sp. NPDC058691 TaxID=3346601 RepID=UPI00365CFBB6
MERQPAQASDREVGDTAVAHHLHRPLQHADLPAVADVRRLLRESLRHWGVPALADTAVLLTTELVTNALRHTDRGAVLTATLSTASTTDAASPASTADAASPASTADAASPASTADAPSPATTAAAHRLRVEVRDFTTRHPRLRTPSSHGTSGRGLQLVQSLADAWGVHAEGDGSGKVVWFELDATPS